MPKPRTWLFIALGTLAILIGLALLVVGAGAWFFASHVKVEQATPATAREREVSQTVLEHDLQQRLHALLSARGGER